MSAPTRNEQAALVELCRLASFAEAEEPARALTIRYPNHEFGWKILGYVLARLGRNEEALAPLREGAKLLPADLEIHKNLGISLLKLGRLNEGEAACRQSLSIKQDEPECLHMLGWICLQTGRAREALELLLRAGDLSNCDPLLLRDLGLALGRVTDDGLEEVIMPKQICYRIWQRNRYRDRQAFSTPQVSVVIPSYNHAEFIEDCLNSVYRQTWRHIELIVIDDGSTDDSAKLIRQSLETCPFPHRFVTRENRGAHTTINEGIAMASGEYINILNSDDRFTPERIAKMVACVAGIGADWGFSDVEVIDASGNLAELVPGTPPHQIAGFVASIGLAPTIGFALIGSNVAISTGNLFFSKVFFERIGGFSDLHYNHDWDFALRATLWSEPVHVPQTHYYYRVHGRNTILESKLSAIREAAGLMDGHIKRLLSEASMSNPFAPTRANWGTYVLKYISHVGRGAHLPLDLVRDLAISIASDTARNELCPSLAPLANSPELATVIPFLEGLPASANGLSATFDQYQRYEMAARAIELMRENGQALSILEVGANTHGLLGRLLTRDEVTFLDNEILASMQGAPNMLADDATDLDMADGSFDIVVALDGFEHIEPARRAAFLHHITRIARRMTLLAAPFDSPAVRRAEHEATVYWDSLFDKPYRWLTGHADHGLPDLGDTTARLDEMGVGYCRFGHGQLDLWREFLKAHFADTLCPVMHGLMSSLDRYYRDRLLDDDSDPAANYRQFLFCSRSQDMLEKLHALCRPIKVNTFSSRDLVPLFEVLNAMQTIASGIRQAQARSMRRSGDQ